MLRLGFLSLGFLSLGLAACASEPIAESSDEINGSADGTWLGTSIDHCDVASVQHQEDSHLPPFNPEVSSAPGRDATSAVGVVSGAEDPSILMATSATVTWNDNTKGTDTVGYLVEFRGENGESYPADFCPNGTRANMNQRDPYGRFSFVKHGLRPGTFYGMRVCAVSARGIVSRGSRASVTTLPRQTEAGDLNNPDFLGEDQSGNGLLVKWRGDAIPGGGFRVDVRDSEVPHDHCTNGTTYSAAELRRGDHFELRIDSHQLAQLQPGTKYGVRVCPTASDGRVGRGSSRFFQTGASTGAATMCQLSQPSRQEDSHAAPFNPEVWAAPGKDGVSGTITWNDNTPGTDGIGFLVDVISPADGGLYPADFCPNGVPANMLQRDAYGRVYFAKEGLRPSTLYNARVCAFTARGVVSRGSTVQFTTVPTAIAGNPLGNPDFLTESNARIPDSQTETPSPLSNELTVRWHGDVFTGGLGFRVEVSEGGTPGNFCTNGETVGYDALRAGAPDRFQFRVRRHQLAALKPGTKYGVRICPIATDGRIGSGSSRTFVTNRL